MCVFVCVSFLTVERADLCLVFLSPLFDLSILLICCVCVCVCVCTHRWARWSVSHVSQPSLWSEHPPDLLCVCVCVCVSFLTVERADLCLVFLSHLFDLSILLICCVCVCVCVCCVCLSSPLSALICVSCFSAISLIWASSWSVVCVCVCVCCVCLSSPLSALICVSCFSAISLIWASSWSVVCVCVVCVCCVCLSSPLSALICVSCFSAISLIWASSWSVVCVCVCVCVVCVFPHRWARWSVSRVSQPSLWSEHPPDLLCVCVCVCVLCVSFLTVERADLCLVFLSHLFDLSILLICCVCVCVCVFPHRWARWSVSRVSQPSLWSEHPPDLLCVCVVCVSVLTVERADLCLVFLSPLFDLSILLICCVCVCVCVCLSSPLSALICLSCFSALSLIWASSWSIVCVCVCVCVFPHRWARWSVSRVSQPSLWSEHPSDSAPRQLHPTAARFSDVLAENRSIWSWDRVVCLLLIDSSGYRSRVKETVQTMLDPSPEWPLFLFFLTFSLTCNVFFLTPICQQYSKH